jgi:hypothetical protein
MKVYIGNFFADQAGGGESRFQLVVAAESPEAAVESFEDYLHASRKRKKDIFKDITKVYVDTIVEVRDYPVSPVMVRFSSFRESLPASLNTAEESEDVSVLNCPWDADGATDGSTTLGKSEVLKPFVEFRTPRQRPGNHEAARSN